MPHLSRPRIGISSCLLGQQVRYDGGHKFDRYINGTLGEYFEFVPVCPEVAIGLGVPRPPIHLVQTRKGLRALGVRDPDLDVTDRLHAYADSMAGRLADLRGYVFKRGSPSCGMERVRVRNENRMPAQTGAGLFAAMFMRRHPLLPCEEEGRLNDPVLRENFITRVYVYDRWLKLLATKPTAADLIAFHSDHKFLLLAHNQTAYRRMGKLVATVGKGNAGRLAPAYGEELMQALGRKATRKSHSNVLEHMLGYISQALSAGDRAEMKDVIGRYRRGLLPLVVPITLFRHHLRHHPNPYLERQVYLQPHPGELMLRNHV